MTAIIIKHTCGHTQQLYRSINDPGIREWVKRQENKTCGCIQCKQNELNIEVKQ